MRTKTYTSLFLAAGFLLSTAAFADGSHGVKIEYESKLQARTEIMVYNGYNDLGLVPHKVYYLDGPGKRTLKCHGQGKHRCFVRVSLTGDALLSAEWVENKKSCVTSKVDGKHLFNCE